MASYLIFKIASLVVLVIVLLLIVYGKKSKTNKNWINRPKKTSVTDNSQQDFVPDRQDYEQSEIIPNNSLVELQNNLLQLSYLLYDLFELSNIEVFPDLIRVDGFLMSYKPQIDQLAIVSERYHEWATKDLQNIIDDIREIETVDIGIEEGISSSSIPAGNPFLPDKIKKADRFREAAKKI